MAPEALESFRNGWCLGSEAFRKECRNPPPPFQPTASEIPRSKRLWSSTGLRRGPLAQSGYEEALIHA
jgi:hypothetical protein